MEGRIWPDGQGIQSTSNTVIIATSMPDLAMKEARKRMQKKPDLMDRLSVFPSRVPQSFQQFVEFSHLKKENLMETVNLMLISKSNLEQEEIDLAVSDAAKIPARCWL